MVITPNRSLESTRGESFFLVSSTEPTSGTCSTIHIGRPSLSFSPVSFDPAAGAISPVASTRATWRCFSPWNPARRIDPTIRPPRKTARTTAPTQKDFFVTRSRYSRRRIIRMLCIADPLQNRRRGRADHFDEDVVERGRHDLELLHAQPPR